MTLLLLEETLPEEEQLTLIAAPAVKCSWCGALVRIVDEKLALAICPPCYERMLAEYERTVKTRCESKQAPIDRI